MRTFKENEKNKDFGAVKMMRDIRNNRHEEYEKHSQLREGRLAAIRKNIGTKLKTKKPAATNI
ncbi:MAG: hypothetical protein K9I68_09970 [Bacteroidales bacterium]|nr:hypothetical protein [Bacteroidales bacterium]MCF8336661.1 hypothetical protein [Bacteroidales bacterium]